MVHTTPRQLNPKREPIYNQYRRLIAKSNLTSQAADGHTSSRGIFLTIKHIYAKVVLNETL